MAEFIPYDSLVEVSGAAILSTIAGMEDNVLPVLAAYGIDQPEADEWYPQQAWLDVLKEISDNGGLLDLVSVGMRIPETALWPPEVDSVEKALTSIDVAYQMNHRNGEIGSYHAEVVDEGHVQLMCDNPYPSDFDYGLIYQTTRKFLPKGETFIVRRADSPSRKHGDDMCIYDVTWGEE